jgi:hypothetical protein
MVFEKLPAPTIMKNNIKQLPQFLSKLTTFAKIKDNLKQCLELKSKLVTAILTKKSHHRPHISCL